MPLQYKSVVCYLEFILYKLTQRTNNTQQGFQYIKKLAGSFKTPLSNFYYHTNSESLKLVTS